MPKTNKRATNPTAASQPRELSFNHVSTLGKQVPARDAYPSKKVTSALEDFADKESSSHDIIQAQPAGRG